MGYLLPFTKNIELGQQFGSNPNWGPNPSGGHNGDDWLTPSGTPVHAAGDGVVHFAGRFDSTYADNWGWNLNYAGPMIILNMDGETAPYFEYGHLSAVYVKTGQRVKRGDVIGLTGADDGGTGVITGAHCHVGCLPYNFNINTNTYGRVNPRLYMTDYVDDSIELAPQSTDTTGGFLVALTDAQQARILAAADRINGVIDDPNAKVLTTKHIGAIVSAVLNTPIKRGGAGAGIGDGVTSLGALVAWDDDHTIQLLSSLADDGATAEEITEAVKAALAESVVKVDVNVGTAQ